MGQIQLFETLCLLQTAQLPLPRIKSRDKCIEWMSVQVDVDVDRRFGAQVIFNSCARIATFALFRS
jgi:hypothetical protein